MAPLKRHPVLIPLSHDHRDILFTANYIRTGAPAYPGFSGETKDKWIYLKNFWSTKLLPHFQFEETVLFPFVLEKATILSEIIDDLIIEHRNLDRLFEKMDWAQPDQLQPCMDELSQKLKEHIRKEERIFFEQIQQILSSVEFQQLDKAISQFKNSTI